MTGVKRVGCVLAVMCLGCAQGEDEVPTPEDPLDGVPSGEFAVGFSLAPVGGLLVPFQVTVTPELSDAGGAEFGTLEVRATDGEEELSELLATATDVAITDDGRFAASFEMTLPGAFSPTQSDVDMMGTMAGSIVTPDFFCGDLTGELTTFEIDLVGSTFGAVPWADRDMGISGSCDDDPNATIERIAPQDCPVLLEGANTAFPSASEERMAIVQLPDGYSAEQSYPLVVAFHGFGGTASGYLTNGVGEAAKSHEVILVVPQALEKGGSASFDAFSDEARNIDLALFDDLVTCASETFSVDDKRVFVTGRSNGGLMAGAILARRASILASAAAVSGGIGVDFAEDHVAIPSLVTWGGIEDFALEQDFHLLAESMITDLDAQGHFLVTCNHGLAHDFPVGGWEWVFDFLLSHELGVLDSPLSAGLPASYPEYCEIAS